RSGRCGPLSKERMGDCTPVDRDAAALRWVTPAKPWQSTPAVLPPHPQSLALQYRLDLGGVHPGEVAGDGVLDRTHRRPVVDRLLQVAVEQAVDQAGGQGVAGSEAVDDLHVVPRTLVQLSRGVADGAEAVPPHEWCFALGARDYGDAEPLDEPLRD